MGYRIISLLNRMDIHLRFPPQSQIQSQLNPAVAAVAP